MITPNYTGKIVALSPYDRIAVFFTADRIVFLCNAFKKYSPDFRAPRTAIIPNAIIREESIDWNREELPRKTILLMARLEEGMKRISVHIDAISRHADAFPDWDLEICGEGSHRVRYEKQIASLDLRGRIRLP